MCDNEAPDGVPRIGRKQGGPWCRFVCDVCGGFFEADRETETIHCSVNCQEEAQRRGWISKARGAVVSVATHNENHATITRIISLLDALYEDDHLDADSAHPEDEGPEAKLAFVGKTLDTLWRHTSTDLDPRFYAALKEMRARLGCSDSPRERWRRARETKPGTRTLPHACDLLKRYAEHHEAHKAEPGTIDAEVAAFIRERGL